MIKTQIVKQSVKPVAVILNYKEYIAADGDRTGPQGRCVLAGIKIKNKKWTSHKDLKKAMGS